METEKKENIEMYPDNDGGYGIGMKKERQFMYMSDGEVIFLTALALVDIVLMIVMWG